MPNTIAVARSVTDLRKIVAGWRKAGETVALVPTMGALHDGHVTLARQGKTKAKRVVVSIFVNPAQFAPTEDLDKYPRTFERDLELLAAVPADLVWAPTVKEMYPDGFATYVTPGAAAEGLETDFRPNFFRGVATVCCKLFTQVGPDYALFGEKDYQQLCVIRQMVRDLNLPLEIIGAETVREADGLAMSSRNRYLSAAERAKAVTIHRAIQEVAKVAASQGDVAAAIAKARGDLAAAGFRKIDYVELRDAQSLKPLDPGSARPARVLAAAWLGTTRLIDNIAVEKAPARPRARKKAS